MNSQLNPEAAVFIPVLPTKRVMIDEAIITASPGIKFEEASPLNIGIKFEDASPLNIEYSSSPKQVDYFMRDNFSTIPNKIKELSTHINCAVPEFPLTSVEEIEHISIDKLLGVQSTPQEANNHLAAVMENILTSIEDDAIVDNNNRTNFGGLNDSEVHDIPEMITLLLNQSSNIVDKMIKSEIILPKDEPTKAQKKKPKTSRNRRRKYKKFDPNIDNSGFITELRRTPPIDLTFKPMQTFSDVNPFNPLQPQTLVSPNCTPIDDFYNLADLYKTPVQSPQKEEASSKIGINSSNIATNTPPSFILKRTPVDNQVVPFEELESPNELPPFVHPPNANRKIAFTELPKSPELEDKTEDASSQKLKNSEVGAEKKNDVVETKPDSTTQTPISKKKKRMNKPHKNLDSDEQFFRPEYTIRQPKKDNNLKNKPINTNLKTEFETINLDSSKTTVEDAVKHKINSCTPSNSEQIEVSIIADSKPNGCEAMQNIFAEDSNDEMQETSFISKNNSENNQATEQQTQQSMEQVTEKPPGNLPVQQYKQLPEKLTEQSMKKLPEKVTEQLSINVTDHLPEKVQKCTEKVTEHLHERVKEQSPEKVSAQLLEKINEKVTKRLLEKAQSLEKVTEKLPESVKENLPEKVIEKLPEKVLAQLPEKLTENLSKKVTEKLPEKVIEKLQEEVTEQLPEKLTEQLPEKVTEQLPEKVKEQLPENATEQLSEKIQQKLPEQLTEQIKEQPSEKLPEQPKEDIIVSSQTQATEINEIPNNIETKEENHKSNNHIDVNIKDETTNMSLELEDQVLSSPSTPEEIRTLVQGFEVIDKDELLQDNYTPDKIFGDNYTTETAVFLDEGKTINVHVTVKNETKPIHRSSETEKLCEVNTMVLDDTHFNKSLHSSKKVEKEETQIVEEINSEVNEHLPLQHSSPVTENTVQEEEISLSKQSGDQESGFAPETNIEGDKIQKEAQLCALTEVKRTEEDLTSSPHGLEDCQKERKHLDHEISDNTSEDKSGVSEQNSSKEEQIEAMTTADEIVIVPSDLKAQSQSKNETTPTTKTTASSAKPSGVKATAPVTGKTSAAKPSAGSLASKSAATGSVAKTASPSKPAATASKTTANAAPSKSTASSTPSKPAPSTTPSKPAAPGSKSTPSSTVPTKTTSSAATAKPASVPKTAGSSAAPSKASIPSSTTPKSTASATSKPTSTAAASSKPASSPGSASKPSVTASKPATSSSTPAKPTTATTPVKKPVSAAAKPTASKTATPSSAKPTVSSTTPSKPVLKQLPVGETSALKKSSSSGPSSPTTPKSPMTKSISSLVSPTTPKSPMTKSISSLASPTTPKSPTTKSIAASLKTGETSTKLPTASKLVKESPTTKSTTTDAKSTAKKVEAPKSSAAAKTQSTAKPAVSGTKPASAAAKTPASTPSKTSPAKPAAAATVKKPTEVSDGDSKVSSAVKKPTITTAAKPTDKSSKESSGVKPTVNGKAPAVKSSSVKPETKATTKNGEKTIPSKKTEVGKKLEKSVQELKVTTTNEINTPTAQVTAVN